MFPIFYLQKVCFGFPLVCAAPGANSTKENNNAKEMHDMGRTYALHGTIKSDVANIKPGTNKTAIRLINCLFMMIYFFYALSGRLLFLIKELC